ncbi:MAG: DUF1573 domain-containing protein [Candidatus Omnitrophica bacterium]|nr:DUF1573 domain-containing protein [Candidatus Omnitrophota bacterium]
MIRIFLCLMFLFLSFPITGCYSQQGNNAIEKVKESDPYTWDFGRVKKGAILKHAFKLKNESNKILNILNVSTSCGCTASEVKKKNLAPKETTLIEVSFKTLGYSGPTQQHVYVNTDSLDNPVIKYTIKADVAKEG